LRSQGGLLFFRATDEAKNGDEKKREQEVLHKFGLLCVDEMSPKTVLRGPSPGNVKQKRRTENSARRFNS
jgi:hypothetical protein